MYFNDFIEGAVSYRHFLLRAAVTHRLRERSPTAFFLLFSGHPPLEGAVSNRLGEGHPFFKADQTST